MVIRHLDNQISSHFSQYKEALILLGARQVGKTTLLKRLFPNANYLNAETEPIKQTLERFDPAAYQQLFDASDSLTIIDEVHKLSDPGRAIKIIYDHLPQLQLIITGSSSFNIKNKTSEIYPLTLNEHLVQRNLEKDLNFSSFEKIITNQLPKEIFRPYDHHTVLDNVLIYGLYPAMLSHLSNPKYLKNLVDSVIFKDLTELSLLENKAAALSLLKLLAHQIGSLVNYAELSNKLGISGPTVKRYIELFEQSFIIFSLKPYSTNHRDEIGKMSKVYFHDLGLRNALIENFQPLETRGDAGQLFENFIVSEIYKYNSYGDFNFHLNYWRTKGGSEVDLVLSKSDNTLIGIEIKTKTRRINQAFKSRYPQAQMRTLSRNNYWV